MELPDDVLAIIRKYSKPVFLYYKEYNQAMKVFGIKAYPPLKEKLQSNPDVVLPALLAYQAAFLHRTLMEKLKQEHYDSYKPCFEKETFYEQNRLHNAVFYARRSEDDARWVLKRHLDSERPISMISLW